MPLIKLKVQEEPIILVMMALSTASSPLSLSITTIHILIISLRRLALAMLTANPETICSYPIWMIE